MTLKVEQFNSQDTPQFSTDLIRFLYSDANKRIQLSFLCNPQVFIMPTKQNDGLIRINRQKKIALKKNGAFTYGAWPQDRVSPIQSKKLNQMIRNHQIRQAGHYYDLAGQACQEYELKDKRYVFIPKASVWFEVKPIEWIYDFKTNTVHSVKAIWSKDELSPKNLEAFGWQALQSNKLILQLQNNSSQNQSQTLRDVESDMLHAVRFLRDKEKENGIVGGKGQKILDMIRGQFYKNKLKGK